MIRLLIIGIAATIFLGGCDPRFVPSTNLSPREIQALVGNWEGQGTLSRAEIKGCPTHYRVVMRVANGNVEGDLVDRATPNAPHTRFTTFLDYDASISVVARPRGIDMTIRGVFTRDNFVGETTSVGCGHRIR